MMMVSFMMKPCSMGCGFPPATPPSVSSVSKRMVWVRNASFVLVNFFMSTLCSNRGTIAIAPDSAHIAARPALRAPNRRAEAARNAAPAHS
jgi:hypothetical protein